MSNKLCGSHWQELFVGLMVLIFTLPVIYSYIYRRRGNFWERQLSLHVDLLSLVPRPFPRFFNIAHRSPEVLIRVWSDSKCSLWLLIYWWSVTKHLISLQLNLPSLEAPISCGLVNSLHGIAYMYIVRARLVSRHRPISIQVAVCSSQEIFS